MSTQNNLSRILEKIREIAEKSSNDNYIYRGEPKHYKKVSSTLYRQYEEDIEAEHFDIEFAQSEMLAEAKDYIHETDEEFEILTQLQHFGGKTNLIDFTTDYLIALFFACESLFDKPGRVILLAESAQEENRAKKPRNIINRVRDQKSVFVRPPKGFIEIEPDDAINIPKCLKQPMLDYLKKYHDISTKTIYNDLHGFIRVQDLHQSAYTEFFKGLTCHDQRQYDKAIEHYTKSLVLNRNHAPTYSNRGNAYINQGKYCLAIADCTRALELNPNHATAYNNRGDAYDAIGKYDLAIADCTRAIELNPKYVNAYNNRGVAYINKGKYNLAIADLTKVIELNPKYVNAYSNRGVVYNNRGEYNLAIADFIKAIELKSNFAEAYNNLGFSHLKQGDYASTIKDCTRALELNSKIVEGYSNRGKALLHLRKWEKAKEDLIAAKKMGFDIIASFRNDYTDVEEFKNINGFELPEDIAEMLTPTQS